MLNENLPIDKMVTYYKVGTILTEPTPEEILNYIDQLNTGVTFDGARPTREDYATFLQFLRQLQQHPRDDQFLVLSLPPVGDSDYAFPIGILIYNSAETKKAFRYNPELEAWTPDAPIEETKQLTRSTRLYIGMTLDRLPLRGVLNAFVEDEMMMRHGGEVGVVATLVRELAHLRLGFTVRNTPPKPLYADDDATLVEYCAALQRYYQLLREVVENLP